MGLFVMIINARILRNEWKIRKSSLSKFTTKYLQLWTFLCILCGTILGLFWVLLYVNGFCYLMPFGGVIVACQPICMGFYQVSRLHYCFSKGQVHSNKGYPDWLFIILYVIGITIIIMSIFGSIFGGIPSVCGINKKYEFYVEFIYFEKELRDFTRLVAGGLIYFTWDILTLLLYAFKIRSFKKFKGENMAIHKRILSILYRVLICTLFYEIVSLICIICYFMFKYVAENSVWSDILYHFCEGLPVVIYSYSLCLMLQHNTMQYIRFLKFLKQSKFNYFCCCYKFIVIDQLDELNVNEEEEVNVNNKDLTVTQFNTNTSLPHEPQPASQISLPTITVNMAQNI
eukprot:115750_1